MKQIVFVLVVSCCAFVLAPIHARAQGDESAADEEAATRVASDDGPQTASEPIAPGRPVAVAEPADVEPAEAPDGVRFRGGIALAGGGEFVSDFAFGMGGVEGRIGIQINNLIGLYVQPSLSFGAGSIGSGVTGFTGTAGVSALVDFTIADHFFVAAGGGVGILNNPVGPEIHFRLGGYPVVVVGEDGYSRQGLMLGVDARIFFLDNVGSTVPVMQLMGSIGYEVF